MRELIKRTFNLWCEKRWLKEIDRAIERYRKTQLKANREHHVMKALVEEYNKLYKRDLMEAKDDGN